MADRKRPERSFEVRVLDGDAEGRFEGYASVFGVVDSYNTVFDRGAFKKTVKERGGWLPIVWMHNANEPIGRAQVREDDKGLWVEGQLDLDVQRGREVHSGMKKGYITRMSHSFAKVPDKVRAVKGEDGTEVLHFREVKSFEVSPVTTNFESNEEAQITGVRAEEETDETPVPVGVPAGMEFQMGRLSALLGEPPTGTPGGEPRCKPGDHLQAFRRELDRFAGLLEG